MIELTSLQNVVRRQALRRTSSHRFRAGFLTSDSQVRLAIEYAIANSMRGRDEQGELRVQGSAFWTAIGEYFKNLPKVSSNYTDIILATIADRGGSHHVTQFLKLCMY